MSMACCAMLACSLQLLAMAAVFITSLFIASSVNRPCLHCTERSRVFCLHSFKCAAVSTEIPLVVNGCPYYFQWRSVLPLLVLLASRAVVTACVTLNSPLFQVLTIQCFYFVERYPTACTAPLCSHLVTGSTPAAPTSSIFFYLLYFYYAVALLWSGFIFS